MRPRRFVFLFGIVLLLSWKPLQAAERPNVVLIISDDQGWTDFGFMGHPTVQTPNIDRLARESLTFTRGYVPSSLCRPSLASMVTGLYPHQHLISGNDPAPPGDELPWNVKNNPEYDKLRARLIAHIDAVPTLPRLLASAGYISHQSGKWWEGSYRRGGFTEGMTRGFPNPGGRHGDDGLKIGREGMRPVFDFINRAKNAGKPFFVWYAPFMPHSPHNPPERLLEKYRDKTDSIQVAKYWAMCEWFDETCGQLIDHIDQQGLAEKTLVLFIVDNGWIQQPDSPKYAPRSKRSPNEGGVRTPIMLRWPGTVQPRLDKTTLAISIDLAPTILHACGLQPTQDMTGVDLLDPQARAKRRIIFGEIFAHDVADVDRPAASLQYRWCIEGPWKLILPNHATMGAAGPELYNVLADPFEKRNEAGANPEIVKRLARAINQWWPGK